ncbi:MAG: signal peptidase I [Planctomycetes bacterium]|nr:signal peptidase I [Planctomycetota bacterium]
MRLTAILIAAFVGLLVVDFLFRGVLLYLGLRWAKIPGITRRRIVLVLVLVLGMGILLLVALLALPRASTLPAALAALAAQLAVVLLVPAWLIARVFGARLGRSLQAWLPTLVFGILSEFLLAGLLRSSLVEGFVCSANSMAPTLLGYHWRGVCPECDRPAFVCAPADEPPFAVSTRGPAARHPLICENFHTSETGEYGPPRLPPDRVLALKPLRPRRWDLVAFRFPTNPSEVFVKRVVGLPGETIHIEDDAVWVDGQKLTPPPSIQGIRYRYDDPVPRELWGTRERPARLGADEYFVLGDFSPNSFDSRLWSQGAPGHPPYAVPASHLRGVVTHIYWPPGRARILR